MYESVRISQSGKLDNKNIYVFRQEFEPPYASMIHAHEFYELEFVLSGFGDEVINGERYEKKRGFVTISTPADYHSFEIKEKTTLIDIMFREDIMPKGLASDLFSKRYARHVELSEEKTEDLLHLCCLIESTSKQNGVFRDTLCKCLLESVILTILAQFEEDGVSVKREKPGEIDAVLQYIDLHFSENPSIAAIAAIADKSPNYFCKYFKRCTGLHYSDYLNIRKIECAEMLLRTSTMSITDVCFLCGFNSLSNFQRVFKEQKMLSPSEYRKKY